MNKYHSCQCEICQLDAVQFAHTYKVNERADINKIIEAHNPPDPNRRTLKDAVDELRAGKSVPNMYLGTIK